MNTIADDAPAPPPPPAPATVPPARPPTARPSTARLLWAAWAASVPVVLLATVAVEAVPRARGIDFFPALRLAVVAPACVLAAAAAAVPYPRLAGRSRRPRAVLAGILFGAAAVVLAATASAGPPGLTGAAAPAVLGAAAALAWVVPRYVDRPRRSRVGTAALALVGAAEVFGVAAAVWSERPVPPDPGGRLAFDVPRRRFDVDHHFLDLPGGGRLHYVDEGRGPTLLFLHGNPSWSFQWRELIGGLRDSYRCVAPDYPGFGLSEPPAGYRHTAREDSLAVEALVDRLALRDVTLVMQDWGGPVGIGLAERRPELVSRVVLGSTWAWPTGTGEPRGMFSVIAGGPVGEFLQVNFNGFAKIGVRNGIVGPVSPEVLELYERPFRPVGRRRGVAAYYPGQITAAGDYFADLEAKLPRLKDKPALIFWGLRDVGFPRRDLERWQAAFPGHATVELPDADHFFFEDAAGRMIPRMRAFLAERR